MPRSAHPSVCFRKTAVCELGEYRDGPFAEDYELWLRMFESERVIGTVPEVFWNGATVPRG